MKRPNGTTNYKKADTHSLRIRFNHSWKATLFICHGRLFFLLPDECHFPCFYLIVFVFHFVFHLSRPVLLLSLIFRWKHFDFHGLSFAYLEKACYPNGFHCLQTILSFHSVCEHPH
jgi:hypothetical protein